MALGRRAPRFPGRRGPGWQATLSEREQPLAEAGHCQIGDSDTSDKRGADFKLAIGRQATGTGSGRLPVRGIASEIRLSLPESLSRVPAQGPSEPEWLCRHWQLRLRHTGTASLSEPVLAA
jgi:hypothetical protein